MPVNYPEEQGRHFWKEMLLLVYFGMLCLYYTVDSGDGDSRRERERDMTCNTDPWQESNWEHLGYIELQPLGHQDAP